MVKIIATAKIAYPALYGENSWRKCLATKTQKTVTGTMISNKLISSDFASGPKINLPPRKKYCKRQEMSENNANETPSKKYRMACEC